MTRDLIKAIIILPGTVLLFVPALVLYVSWGTRFSAQMQHPTQFTFVVALVPLAVHVGHDYLLLAAAMKQYARLGRRKIAK